MLAGGCTTAAVVGLAARWVAQDIAMRRQYPAPASANADAAAPPPGRSWQDLTNGPTEPTWDTGRPVAPPVFASDHNEPGSDDADDPGVLGRTGITVEQLVEELERREALTAAETGRCCWVIRYDGWDGGRQLCGDAIQAGYIFCPEHLYEVFTCGDDPQAFAFEYVDWIDLSDYASDDDPVFDPAAFEANLPPETSAPPAQASVALGGRAADHSDQGQQGHQDGRPAPPVPAAPPVPTRAAQVEACPRCGGDAQDHDAVRLPPGAGSDAGDWHLICRPPSDGAPSAQPTAARHPDPHNGVSTESSTESSTGVGDGAGVQGSGTIRLGGFEAPYGGDQR